MSYFLKKVMTSNIVADTISHIHNGELKESLTRFVELNEKVRSDIDKETLKNSILEEFDRNLVENELNKSLKDNTKEKVISDFFNVSVDEIKDRYKTPDESPKEPEKLPENPKEPENKPEPERQNNNNNDTSGGSGNSSSGGSNQTQPPVIPQEYIKISDNNGYIMLNGIPTFPIYLKKYRII